MSGGNATGGGASSNSSSTSPGDGVSPLRILAIHAHPDDVEFQCAGTLALLAQKGCAITIATVTPGDCGSRALGRGNRRDPPGRGPHVWPRFWGRIRLPRISRPVDHRRQRQPRQSLRMPPPGPARHRADGSARRLHDRPRADECARPRSLLLRLGPQLLDPPMVAGPAARRIPHLYYVDSIEGADTFGRPVKPDFIIDVTATFETKQKMLACHESQRQLAPQTTRHRRIHAKRPTLVRRPRQRNRHEIRRSLPPTHGPPVSARQSAAALLGIPS